MFGRVFRFLRRTLCPVAKVDITWSANYIQFDVSKPTRAPVVADLLKTYVLTGYEADQLTFDAERGTVNLNIVSNDSDPETIAREAARMLQQNGYRACCEQSAIEVETARREREAERGSDETFLY